VASHVVLSRGDIVIADVSSSSDVTPLDREMFAARGVAQLTSVAAVPLWATGQDEGAACALFMPDAFVEHF
jgi:hypothetical protein